MRTLFSTPMKHFVMIRKLLSFPLQGMRQKLKSPHVRRMASRRMKGIPNQDFSLQHALAADRLRGLKRTRSQLRKQLSDLNEDCISSGIGDDRLLADLVKDESKAKTKSETGQESIKKQKKKRKIVSYGEDDGFDDLLNAASGGLIEIIKKALRRVKVEVTHCGNMWTKYRISGLTSQATRELTFPVDERGRMKSVVQYFLETYDFAIQHTNWPCLHVGNQQRPNYLPMEVCKIVEG